MNKINKFSPKPPRITVDKRQIKALLSLMLKGTDIERKALYCFMEQNVLPFHLCLLEKSRDKLIQNYVTFRKKKLYTVKKSFEKEFSDRICCPLQDILEWEAPWVGEIRAYRRESERFLNGDTDVFDNTEAIEFVRYNTNLALTSPSAYIRGLAELMIEKKK